MAQAGVTELNATILEIGASASTRLTALEALNLQETQMAVSTLRDSVVDCSDRMDIISAACKGVEKDSVDMRVAFHTTSRSVSDMNDLVNKNSHEWHVAKDTIEEVTRRMTSMQGDFGTLETIVDSVGRTFTARYTEIRDSLALSVGKVAEEQRSSFKRLQESLVKPADTIAGQSMLMSVISAARRFMADAKFDSLNRNRSNAILMAWYRESVNSVRRKLGAHRFKDFVNRRARCILWDWERMNYVQKLSGVIEVTVEREVSNCVHVQQSATVLDRLRLLDSSVAALAERHSDVVRFQESLTEMHTWMETTIADAERERSATMNPQSEGIVADLQSVVRRMADVEAKINAIMIPPLTPGPSKTIVDQPETSNPKYARVDQLQDILTNVLMLWNHVKQLGESKVDKEGLKDLIDENVRRAIPIGAVRATEDMRDIRETIESLKNSVDALELSRPTTRVTVSEGPMQRPHFSPRELSHVARTPTLITQPKSMGTASAGPALKAQSMDKFLQYARSVLDTAMTDSRSEIGIPRVQSAKSEPAKRSMRAVGKRIPPAGGWGMNRAITGQTR